MKKVKKFIAYVLVFALTLGTMGGMSFQYAVTQAEENDEFAYVFNDDGTITIIEVKQTVGDIVIPDMVDGYVVTGIGSRANEWGMTGAFENKWQITNIYLPDTITYFGERAFASCGVQHIYSYNPLEGAWDTILPSTGADDVADSDTDSLPEEGTAASGPALAFPAALTTIEAHCFDNSTGLKEVNLPASIKTVGDFAFTNTGIVSFEIPEGAQVDYLGTRLFNGPIQTITIKGHVSQIADEAFADLRTLKTVTVTETGSVGTIGAHCLQNCGGKEDGGLNLYFYGRVDVLGNNALEGSGGITEFYMKNVGSIGNEAFLNCNIRTLTLEGSITSIGDRAFVGCSNVDKVTINSSTEYTIGKYAFSTSSIREVVFSDGLKVVQEGTFSGCGHIEKVFLPSTLEKIEENAFENVSTITEITINDTAVVDENAFRGAGGTTWGALDRSDNATVKKIVDKALNRSSVTPTPTPTATATTVKVAKAKLKQAKSNKKKTKATLKWAKNSDATGYVVYVKVVEKGKKAGKKKWKKVKDIKKNKTTKLTVKISSKQKKILKKKGKIYYGIRAYKTVTENGKKKKYYSGYSQKKLK